MNIIDTMQANIVCACRSLCVTLYGVNDYAVLTLYNPLYNRLNRVCALLYVATQCIDMPTARMLFAVVVVVCRQSRYAVHARCRR